MNLLLDTHIALWAIADNPKLSAVARELIESPKATIWISTASLWEIAIKHGLGRGDMPISSQEATAYFTQAGYHFLDVQPNTRWPLSGSPRITKTPSTACSSHRRWSSPCACSPTMPWWRATAIP